MNTYDPMDRIVYLHLGQPRNPGSVPSMSTPRVDCLPSGYANRSPRTYLGRSRRTTQAA